MYRRLKSDKEEEEEVFYIVRTTISRELSQLDTTMNTPSTILLTDLLSLSPAKIHAELGGIYEHSLWVAESAFPDESVVKSLKSLQDVYQVMKKSVDEASNELKLNLLKEHPDLCKRAAVDVKGLTASSREEQSRAQLNQRKFLPLQLHYA